ncbi:CheR family methyltransferase [Falsiroseomonas sp. HC035]|uniref:CheR family methyltransferase n=1 Tax=Falsiroseomonas sp. HC035 TaxID=3390999 RepID=UPI003D3196E2
MQARLARLAGFAESDVLRNRLKRAAPLLARLPLDQANIDQPEWAALLDAVTVQETRMFRAAPQLAAFRTQVLPLLARRGALALVSAGCATGEEAWTLAILGTGAGVPWQVEGLDLCRPALQAAMAARYRLGPPDALREVTAEDRALLEVAGDWFSPAPALRAAVAFRRANLLDAALPDRAADAILCRNVLIYMTEEGRVAVLRRLAAALRPGGALLLGPTDRPPKGLGLVPWSRDLVGIWRRDMADG